MSSKIVSKLLHLKWHREIPFKGTFSFDYQGDEYYYINQTRYKIKKMDDSIVLKIDNPIFSNRSPTKNPSEVKLFLQETPEGSFLKVEFQASFLSKIFEFMSELAFASFAIYELTNRKWLIGGMLFLIVFVIMGVSRLEEYIETRYVISDLKTLCDRKKEE